MMDDDVAMSPLRPEDHYHPDFAVFVKENFYSCLLPTARRYLGFRGIFTVSDSDLVQDALLVTWRKWLVDDVASRPCRLQLAYVYTTMSNIARAHQRKQRRSAKTLDPDDLCHIPASDPGPERRALASGELRALVDAMAALSSADRHMLDLVIAGVRRADIAAHLGISASNVTTRLGRIRDCLRQDLNPNTTTKSTGRAARRQHRRSES